MNLRLVMRRGLILHKYKLLNQSHVRTAIYSGNIVVKQNSKPTQIK